MKAVPPLAVPQIELSQRCFCPNSARFSLNHLNYSLLFVLSPPSPSVWTELQIETRLWSSLTQRHVIGICCCCCSKSKAQMKSQGIHLVFFSWDFLFQLHDVLRISSHPVSWMNGAWLLILVQLDSNSNIFCSLGVCWGLHHEGWCSGDSHCLRGVFQ